MVTPIIRKLITKLERTLERQLEAVKDTESQIAELIKIGK